MSKLVVLFYFFIILKSGGSWGNCQIIKGSQNRDILTFVLEQAENCPKNIIEFKAKLKLDGLSFKSYMVANRGYHNPRWGSFSIFETVSGRSNILGRAVLDEDLYFGHFTRKDKKNTIVLDQQNLDGKLLIEVMAFDYKKKVYNFYELIAHGSGPKWFYRGDSFDIYEDNKNLKLTQLRASKLRCSACHVSGGPILKELDAPHADWWSKKKKLPMGNANISIDLEQYLSQLKDVKYFAKAVKRGIARINIEKAVLKQKLKPLFCTTEINLKSDISDDLKKLSIPADIFVNPFLHEGVALSMNRKLYQDALAFHGSRFPETSLSDSMYAFHAPVKGYSNIRAIKKLVRDNIIDKEFMLDILTYDFKRPLFSKKRCQLLNFIGHGFDWKNKFIDKLVRTGRYQDLVLNLKLNNSEIYKNRISEYLQEIQLNFNSASGVIKAVGQLNILRQSVYIDEISQNPRGQILEPGFRIIFPEVIMPLVDYTSR